MDSLIRQRTDAVRTVARDVTDECANRTDWLDCPYLHVPAHIACLSKTWFEITAGRTGLRLVPWDTSSENGQAFEAVLEIDSSAGQGWWARRRRRRASR